jgi:hypothetical protein
MAVVTIKIIVMLEEQNFVQLAVWLLEYQYLTSLLRKPYCYSTNPSLRVWGIYCCSEFDSEVDFTNG